MCSVEFPSLSWFDKTPETALAGIRQLVNSCLVDMAKNKEPILEPIALKRYSGNFMVRVPPETHRMLSIKAVESGISLNRLVSSKLN